MSKKIDDNSNAETSSIKDVSRTVPSKVRDVLIAISGGRCEFDGCNRFLFEHHVTTERGIFGEAAHIVAFSERGPRGNHEARPAEIHDVDNLMLLCRVCHKLVDDAPETYSVELLRQHKEAHEERIRYLTELSPDRKTVVLQVTSMVRDQRISIPYMQIVQAVSPRYPASRSARKIDLSAFTEGKDSFSVAIDSIKRQLDRCLGPESQFAEISHLSVFALARISLLIALGHSLGNKMPVDLYQRHRDTNDWKWKTDGDILEFQFGKRQDGKAKKVALVAPLSGSISTDDLPDDIKDDYAIYEISPIGVEPNPTILRRKQDLINFRSMYAMALSSIVGEHGLIDEIAFVPAVPAPVAVACGQDRLPDTHPALGIYEKEKGGYQKSITIS